jgi:peroxiredoxin
LSDRIKNSYAGRSIYGYLEGRDRLKENKYFSDFSLPDSASKQVHLFNMKSDYVLLDFWFSNCGPCIASFPDLMKLYQKTRRGKFEVIGISVDRPDEKNLWKSTLVRLQLPWINLHDAQYEVGKIYSVGFFPTKVLLDKKHQILKLNPSIAELEKYLNL